jgi:hypothetical protein
LDVFNGHLGQALHGDPSAAILHQAVRSFTAEIVSDAGALGGFFVTVVGE